MYFCTACGLEMICTKTGRDVTFTKTNQTYSGDEYECPFCENKIIACAQIPRHSHGENFDDGRLLINGTETREMTIEEGEAGEIIGIYLMRQRMGKPTEAMIKEILERDYPLTAISQKCEEFRPGVWLIGSYVVLNGDG